MSSLPSSASGSQQRIRRGGGPSLGHVRPNDRSGEARGSTPGPAVAWMEGAGHPRIGALITPRRGEGADDSRVPRGVRHPTGHRSTRDAGARRVVEMGAVVPRLPRLQRRSQISPQSLVQTEYPGRSSQVLRPLEVPCKRGARMVVGSARGSSGSVTGGRDTPDTARRAITRGPKPIPRALASPKMAC
jgi:hypothetical protein